MGTNSIVDRMIGVARLDVPTYEEIEHDESATQQALIVVVIVAIASGIGQIVDNGALGLIGGLISAVVGWALFSVVAYFIGTKVLPGENTSATIGQLLRSIGFAQTPGILSIFLLIPILGSLIAFVGGIWALVTAIIAIRQALDISTGRAIAVGIIAAIATGIILFLIFLPFGIASVAFS